MITLKRCEMCWLGGTSMMKTLKRVGYCSCNFQYSGRGETGEEVETSGWGNFSDDNFLKRDEKFL